MKYSARFRSEAVRKLAMPGGPSATTLSEEVGVAQSTLSRWLRRAGSLGLEAESPPNLVGKVMAARRPQDWSAEEKLAAVIETSALPAEALGAFLRHRGLHEVHLQEWRQRLLASLVAPGAATTKSRSREARRIRQLEQELARKEKALVEAAALLLLKKKVAEFWGDEADPTDRKNGNRR